jgi:hypothetical protein
MLRSFGVGVGVGAGVADARGATLHGVLCAGADLRVRVTDGVADLVVAGAFWDAGGFWVAAGFVDVVLGWEVGVGVGVRVGVLTGAAGGTALTVTPVRSLPARSMATEAVADTPMTAASQIATMPPVERQEITMWPLCHLRNDNPQKPATPLHGVACSCGNYLVDRG